MGMPVRKGYGLAHPFHKPTDLDDISEEGLKKSIEEMGEMFKEVLGRRRGSTPPTKRPPGVRLPDDDCGGKRYC